MQIIEFKSTSEVSSVSATINVAWIPFPSNEVEVEATRLRSQDCKYTKQNQITTENFKHRIRYKSL
jgi:hypothetical protein